MTPHSIPSLFCFGFDGITMPDHLRPWLESNLGGVILFRRNLQNLSQICQLMAMLHAASSAPLLVGVDQEGGRVTRLPAPFLAPPPAATLGAIGDEDFTRDLARAMGRELRAAGFTWNLAPVLDVHTNPRNPIIGDRAFSHDPECVAQLGAAAIRGFTEAGILATAKHFPGHGDTMMDSHLTLPESLQPSARWRAVEFVPFRQAIRSGVPLVMVAHLACPALDPASPSSLSQPIITGILREELGYDGVVVSDDLEMEAIAARLDLGEAAVRFLEAGGDLVLICQDPGRQRAALAAVEAAVAVGRLSEARLAASLDRIARVRRRLETRLSPVDAEAAQAIVGSVEHQRLLQSILAAAARSRTRDIA
jgi:beta-N-acetylhexosaminidase